MSSSPYDPFSKKTLDLDEKNQNPKINRKALVELFQKFKIELNLNEEFNWQNPKYFYGEDKELKILYKKAIYNDKVIEEKNYIRYLIFIDTIMNYIKQIKNKIMYKGKIYFEFTKESESQSEEMTEKNKDIYNVKCIYSLEYDKEIKFRDDNILIDGINGKRQGFLFFIEELCNEDYDED